MTTLDLIQSKLTQLDESNLQQIYAFIENLPQPTTKSGLLKKLRQIQIDAPTDFTSNLDQYLNQDQNAESPLS
jgi:hypothetical protein